MQTIQMPLSPHPQAHPCSRFKSLDPISVLSRLRSWPGRGRLTTSTHTSGPPSPLSGGFCRSNNWKLQNDDANPDSRWQLRCFVSRSGKVARRGPWRREKIHRLSLPFAAFCCCCCWSVPACAWTDSWTRVNLATAVDHSFPSPSHFIP